LLPEQVETPAGRALVEDAVKRVERLHVSDQFRVRVSRWAWLPLVPAVAVFLLATFLHPAVKENEAGGSVPTVAQKKQIKTATEAYRRKLLDREKEAQKKGLKDAEELFAKLEQGTKELSKADLGDRKRALVEMNNLAKDLDKRRQQLGGSEKLQDQFKQQLKNLDRGPGDKLADAMRKGDFDRAKQELQQLKDKIEKGQFDEKSKAELEKQLKQMEDKLRQAAEAHEKKKDDLKKQIEKARSQGQKDAAEQLEKQLSKLEQQSSQMKQMKQMAEKLGECAKCMQQGDKQGAAEAMSKLQEQLDQLKQEADELEMLDEALSELDSAKDSMACKECNGEGCQACMGDGQGDRPGMGLGRGRGRGARPEEKTDTGFYDTKVQQKKGKGTALVAGYVDGPNMAGQVEQEIQTQFESAKSDDADPLTGQQLPRSYREHAKKYFDSFREGR
jgi:DNA repair exonuclease SbcCD ATPase subunit